jgi:uncharacterized protein (TIRG00374 family)
LTRKQKTVLKVIGFFVVGFSVLYLVYYSQNQQYLSELKAHGIDPVGKSLFQKIIQSFKEARLSILFIVLFCFMISNISRALRWRMLLEPIAGKTSLVNAFSSIMAAYMVNLGVPRSGEFVRAGLMAKYEDIPAEKVMGTIVTDRVIDVLSLAIAIGLALVFSFQNMYEFFQENSSAESNYTILIVLVGIGIFGLVVLYLIYRYRSRIFQSSLGKKILNIILGFAEGLKTVFRLKNPMVFVFHSVVIWVMYYLMTYLSFFATAPTSHLSPVAGLVVFVFGTLGFVFPAPGGMGSYQYLVSEALTKLYGLTIGDASSFANIVFFAVTIFGNIFFGIISFILLPIYNARYVPARKNTPSA